MFKTILKESIIVLLLCIVIILILSIVFYDYNPVNKVVPSKVAYTIPESISAELEEEETIKNTIEIEDRVYTIEGSDLNLYKKSKTYNASKSNPFASGDGSSASTNNAGSNTSSVESGTSSQTTNNSQTTTSENKNTDATTNTQKSQKFNETHVEYNGLK